MAGNQGIDLSTAFEGSSLADATCLLHMLYGSVAGAGSFFRLSLAGRLQRVAQLAHKLDAAPFLAKLDGYLQELAHRPRHFSMPHLLAAVQAAQACQLDATERRCLDALAQNLAAGGTEPAALEALDSSTLAQLLVLAVHKARCQAAELPAIVDSVSYRGLSGGFTFRITGLGGDEDINYDEPAISPWVDIGGFKWRLEVHPFGDLKHPRGAHAVPVYIEMDTQHALQAGADAVTALYSIAVLDQRSIGSTAVNRGKGVFLHEDRNDHGWPSFMSVRELQHASRGYQAGGQMLVRAEVTVVRTDAA